MNMPWQIDDMLPLKIKKNIKKSMGFTIIRLSEADPHHWVKLGEIPEPGLKGGIKY